MQKSVGLLNFIAAFTHPAAVLLLKIGVPLLASGPPSPLGSSSVSNGSGLGLEPEPNRCNGSYHTKTRTVAIGPVLPPKPQRFKSTILPPIKYLSSDRIVT